MRKHGPGWRQVAGLAAFVWPLIAQGAGSDRLRLIAESSGATYDAFGVAGDVVVVRREHSTEAVPTGAVWHLEGDLRAARDLFWFAPEYDLVTTVANEALETDPVLRHALVRLRGRTAWNNGTLRGGIVVVAWLVDGRVVEVVPVAARAHDDEDIGLVAAVAVPLNATTARGAPAMLLWKGNRFVAPRRWFDEATANAALAEMFLGSSEQAAARLREVKKVDERPELPADELQRRALVAPGEVGAIFARRDAGVDGPSLADAALFSLSDFALDAGRTDALQVLLERGAQLNRAGSRPSAALRSAAQNGRYDTIAFLRGRSTDVLETESSRADLRRYALAAGHADVAAALVETGGGSDAGAIARLALLQGDVAALAQLSAHDAAPAVVAQSPALIAFNLRLGRAEVIRSLLQAGLSPRGAIDGTPWLVVAAASGSVECVDQLLAAGADVNAADAHDASALLHAVIANQPAVVEHLLERGRAEQRRDGQGRSPLDLALMMQSSPLVEILARRGATIEVNRPDVEEAISHVLALDAVDLLKRAAADGWNTHMRFHEHWSAAAIAQLQGAKQCAAWLATLVPEPAGPGATLARGDVAAVFASGDTPVEVRTGDVVRPAMSVKVTGVVADDGVFLFPRVTDCGDARLAGAVVTAARSWRFHPATVAGRPVASRVALMIPFPGADRRVFSAGAVVIAPAFAGMSATASAVGGVPVAVQAFQSGCGGGDPVRATVEFGPLAPTTTGDYWAAASLVVEPDGQPGEIQILGVEGMIPQGGWGRALSVWKFTPGKVDDRPVRTRLTLLVQAEE